ncbi:Beta-barrel assembly-enhancing protease [bacterium HR15]|nr:Beta-barrel assembly-enhancing protease [bacterium HR15]
MRRVKDGRRGIAVTTGILALQIVALQGAWTLTDRPLVLVAQTRTPLVHTEQEQYDPNIDLTHHLMRYLKELRKVEVMVYHPQHPAVQQFAAEKGLEPKMLESPDVALLLQIGRALKAAYVLVVRCTRSKESQLLEYEVQLWHPGRRTPLWQTAGNQQARAHDSLETALQSLTRTITLQLDTEIWSHLPSSPTSLPLQREKRASEPTDGGRTTLSLDTLIGEGRWNEALLLLRAAVNQNPLDATLRLRLIELYRRLGLQNVALDECERAMRLMPQSEPLVLMWAELMREQGKVADAIRTLQEMLQAKGGQTLALLLFDLQLMSGDFAGAEATFATMRPTNAPEVHWRAYLLQGVKRQFTMSQEPTQLTRERLPALLFVASGVMNDLANELLDLKRLAIDPAPDWKSLRERGEKIVIQSLDFGAWLGQLQPDDSTRDACAHLQFGAHLMGQAAQQMARYLLFRKVEDLENATLLRAEALRELEAATRLSEPNP